MNDIYSSFYNSSQHSMGYFPNKSLNEPQNNLLGKFEKKSKDDEFLNDLGFYELLHNLNIYVNGYYFIVLLNTVYVEYLKTNQNNIENDIEKNVENFKKYLEDKENAKKIIFNKFIEMFNDNKEYIFNALKKEEFYKNKTDLVTYIIDLFNKEDYYSCYSESLKLIDYLIVNKLAHSENNTTYKPSKQIIDKKFKNLKNSLSKLEIKSSVKLDNLFENSFQYNFYDKYNNINRNKVMHGDVNLKDVKKENCIFLLIMLDCFKDLYIVNNELMN